MKDLFHGTGAKQKDLSIVLQTYKMHGTKGQVGQPHKF